MWQPETTYSVEGIMGYDLKDLLEYCIQNNMAKEFDAYMEGKTGGMAGDKLIVFVYDWERFINRYEKSN